MLLADVSHMIMVILHMKVSSAKRQELSQTISSLVGSIRMEKGCGRCDFFCSMEDENSFCLFQEWDTQKSLEKHSLSKRCRVLRGVMHLLEEPCEIISYRVKKGKILISGSTLNSPVTKN